MTYVNPKDFIRNAARRNPDKTAIMSAAELVSYATSNDPIERLSCKLKAAGGC